MTSVGLHDAISSFIVGHGEGAGGIGIAAGISLTTEWAFVPFSVTLAWQCFRPRWLCVPTGLVALASPAIAGLLFGWPTKAIFDTIVPCSTILALGYRSVARAPDEHAFARCARVVALVGAVWLGAVVLIDAALLAFSSCMPGAGLLRT